MSQLSLEQVRIEYDGHVVVPAMSFAVEEGQIACLLGPSGCGKTTLLRAIAGFEPVSQGAIYLNQQVISSAELQLPPEKRNIGMVFQDYALFPHLTIADNIAFGIRKDNQKAKQKRIADLLELVNLAGYERRYPHELSGGQQQRIALARALAPKPRLLLLDEPFGSQDVELREMLAREVRDILKREGMTAILVTHDEHEAFAMADEIGVLHAGRLQQWDSAYNLYHNPVNAFVAAFIGQGALLQGTVLNASTVATPLGPIQGIIPAGCEPDCPVTVLIRPDDIRLVADAPRQARITARIFRGSHYLYTLELADQSQLLALSSSHDAYPIGEQVSFELDMQHQVILPNDPEQQMISQLLR